MCSHGSILSGNLAGYRVTSQRKSTISTFKLVGRTIFRRGAVRMFLHRDTFFGQLYSLAMPLHCYLTILPAWRIAGPRPPLPQNAGDQKAKLDGPASDSFVQNVHATCLHRNLLRLDQCASNLTTVNVTTTPCALPVIVRRRTVRSEPAKFSRETGTDRYCQ